MKILVTGANGFLGLPLSHHLINTGHKVDAAVRYHNLLSIVNSEINFKSIGDINEITNWKSCLADVECVVHLANRAHVINEQSSNLWALYKRVNTEGTINLAKQATLAGVRRFIFVSSTKVNGKFTLPGSPFTHMSQCTPFDPYGLSKYEAEIGLKLVAEQTGLEVVIIRPPLIYGPRVKANFLKMMRWVEMGIPLPFGAIHNKRSMIGLDNLIDFIELCLTHPGAVGQTFLVSDDHDLSTAELVKEIAFAMRRQSKLLSIPHSFIEKLLISIGQRHISEKLCSSFQVDISFAKERLSWSPPYSIKNQISKTVFDYLVKYQR